MGALVVATEEWICEHSAAPPSLYPLHLSALLSPVLLLPPTAAVKPGVQERVAEEYLQHLMGTGQYEAAAALCPTVLEVSGA